MSGVVHFPNGAFAGADASYLHVETRAERLVRLANQCADEAERLMQAGALEAEFIDFAEAADELTALADLVDPFWRQPTTLYVGEYINNNVVRFDQAAGTL